MKLLLCVFSLPMLIFSIWKSFPRNFISNFSRVIRPNVFITTNKHFLFRNESLGIHSTTDVFSVIIFGFVNRELQKRLQNPSNLHNVNHVNCNHKLNGRGAVCACKRINLLCTSIMRVMRAMIANNARKTSC